MTGWADTPGATDVDQEHARLAVNLLRRLMLQTGVCFHASCEGIYTVEVNVNAFDVSLDELRFLNDLVKTQGIDSDGST